MATDFHRAIADSLIAASHASKIGASFSTASLAVILDHGMPKKVLSGYVQRKKKLISPLNALDNIKSIGFVDDLLPELLWLGLIHDHYNYIAGRDVLECVTTLEKTWPKLENPMNFALQSSYGGISDDQKSALLSAWREKGLLEKIQYALAPLVLLYDDFALRFVGPPDSAVPQEALINRLEKVVSTASDRYSTQGVMLYGALFLNNLMAGRIHISQEIDFPDFDSVIYDIDSADGKRAASFLRASAMAQMSFASPPGDWASRFWARSYELISCSSNQ